MLTGVACGSFVYKIGFWHLIAFKSYLLSCSTGENQKCCKGESSRPLDHCRLFLGFDKTLDRHYEIFDYLCWYWRADWRRADQILGDVDAESILDVGQQSRSDSWKAGEQVNGGEPIQILVVDVVDSMLMSLIRCSMLIVFDVDVVRWFHVDVRCWCCSIIPCRCRLKECCMGDASDLADFEGDQFILKWIDCAVYRLQNLILWIHRSSWHKPRLTDIDEVEQFIILFQNWNTNLV